MFKNIFYKILNKIWNYSNDNKLITYIVYILSSIGFYILNIIKIFIPNHWSLDNFIFLSILGKNKLEHAINYLYLIEKQNKINDNIKILYLALCNYCFKNNKLECIIDIFEYRAYKNSEDLWAWRILIDLNYYICNFDIAKKHHEFYRNKIKESSLKEGLQINNQKYFGSYFTSSIGHSCILADHVILKSITNSQTKDILYISKDKVANSNLISYLSPFFEVVYEEDNAILESTINKLEDPFAYLFLYEDKWEHWYDVRYDLYNKWFEKNNNKPLLSLSNKDIEYGWSHLKKFGIKKNDWFIVLHVRFSPGGSLRNTNIFNYSKAIDKIIENGGWVIRIGDINMPSIPARKNLIDFSQAKIKYERLDIFLLGHCLFAINSTSGPANVPILFGKCSLQTNLVPLRHSVPNKLDIVIPTIFYSKKKKRAITFREIFCSDISYSETSKCYFDDLIKIENTDLDILNGTIEMLEIHLNNKPIELSNLQIKFKKLCQELNVKFQPNISSYFLEKNSNLLEL